MLEKHGYVPNRGHGQGDQSESGDRCLDCGQPESDPVHMSQWIGDSQFWLMYQPEDDEDGRGNVGIDVDETGWIEKNKVHMRSPGTWILMAKRPSRPVFSVVLNEGDQFYFTKRHVGNLMAAKEVICWGIGKKKADGTPVNLWLLPNGVVCGGDDVDILAPRMIR